MASIDVFRMMDKSKISILYIITKANWGGAQRYVYDLATHLDPKKYSVVVATGGEGLLTERLRAAGVRTVEIPALARDVRLFKDFKAFCGLLRVIAREAPDVVHVNSSKAGGFGALASHCMIFLFRRRPTVVFTVHGWAFLEDRPRPVRFFLWFASWLTALLCDHIIFVSRRDAVLARRFIARRKIVLIPNGIEAPHFFERAQARAFLMQRARSPFPAATTVVGTIAELTPNKRIEDLIDAFGMAVQTIRNKHLALCIIGAGEEKQALRRRAEEMRGTGKAIFFLGFITDASRYLKGFDIFVLPSAKEGLPYVVMEAMSVGIPVIATSVGGIPDLISDKTNGILVPPKEPEILAETISFLVKDTAAALRLGARAKEKIKLASSLGLMVEKTAALYKRP